MSTENKVKNSFKYKVVKKGIVNRIKASIKLPVYVLEYLISQYYTEDSSMESIINKVKEVLDKHYIMPEDKNKILDNIKTIGSVVIIDKLSVQVDLKKDIYNGIVNTAGIKDIIVDDTLIMKHKGLIEGGMWGLIRLERNDEGSNKYPVCVGNFNPMQVDVDGLDDLISARQKFTRDEWLDLLIKSIGLNPKYFSFRQKLLMLLRLVPHCETNFNLIELGPRETGKSYTYNELSPYSLLIAGGKASVAVLFYHLGKKEVGLVGTWDVVAFDEVANVKFDDPQGPSMLQTYMESGNFARSNIRIEGKASMVFIGNIDNPLEVWQQGGNLFSTLADELQTPALMDRFHYYLPGWEMPKMKVEYYSNEFGFISDYFSRVLHNFRRKSYSDVIDKYFTLDTTLGTRDVKSIRKTISGLLKLIHPDYSVTKEELKQYLEFAMEGRMRVKEQLKRRGGLEFFGSNFRYYDKEAQKYHQVFLKEMKSASGGLISPVDVGEVFTVITKEDRIFPLKLEIKPVEGNGKFQLTGKPSPETKDTIKNIFNYLKANTVNMGISHKFNSHNYIAQIIDENHSGGNHEIGSAFYVAMISNFLEKPLKPKTIILGSMTVNGNLIKVSNLSEKVSYLIEQGAKTIYIPISNQPDLVTLSADIWSKLIPIVYSDPEDLVKKCFELE
ncbi:MAG: protease Lon-related BREX system protein BrxL [bacterium]